jgi:hypothetical protein
MYSAMAKGHDVVSRKLNEMCVGVSDFCCYLYSKLLILPI